MAVALTTYGPVRVPDGLRSRIDISVHAADRIKSRSIPMADVFAALGAPTHILAADDGVLLLVDEHSRVTVVLAGATVLTVYRWERKHDFRTARQLVATRPRKGPRK